MAWQQSLTTQKTLLAQKAISSVELTQAFLTRIQQYDPAINSFITVLPDTALAAARAADARRAAGTDVPPLLGIPIAHKDIFCTQGVRTSMGSRMLDRFTAPYDATIVTRLAQQGCIMLGKTNMDEFAMGSSNETSYYGPVRNPWDHSRVPGGSSGGSAAAVAARLCAAATGSDTGGSIRQPAALCNLVGLKPTYGRCSRSGMIAFASSLDVAGPLTHTVEDAAWLFQAMAGRDPADATSIAAPLEDPIAHLHDPLPPLRLGLPRQCFDAALDPAIGSCMQAAIAVFERLGLSVHPVDLPHLSYGVAVYYVLASAEAASNLARYDGIRYGHHTEQPATCTEQYLRTRSEGFGAEVQRRILVGTYALSAGHQDAYYLRAQKVRAKIAGDFAQAFDTVDILLAPTAPGTAFPLGDKLQDPVQMYLQDLYTIPVSLAGLPALNLPAGFVDGLPVGLQLIGPACSEAHLLQIGAAYQQHTDWHTRFPPDPTPHDTRSPA